MTQQLPLPTEATQKSPRKRAADVSGRCSYVKYTCLGHIPVVIGDGYGVGADKWVPLEYIIRERLKLGTLGSAYIRTAPESFYGKFYRAGKGGEPDNESGFVVERFVRLTFAGKWAENARTNTVVLQRVLDLLQRFQVNIEYAIHEGNFSYVNDVEKEKLETALQEHRDAVKGWPAARAAATQQTPPPAEASVIEVPAPDPTPMATEAVVAEAPTPWLLVDPVSPFLAEGDNYWRAEVSKLKQDVEELKSCLKSLRDNAPSGVFVEPKDWPEAPSLLVMLDSKESSRDSVTGDRTALLTYMVRKHAIQAGIRPESLEELATNVTKYPYARCTHRRTDVFDGVQYEEHALSLILPGLYREIGGMRPKNRGLALVEGQGQ